MATFFARRTISTRNNRLGSGKNRDLLPFSSDEERQTKQAQQPWNYDQEDYHQDQSEEDLFFDSDSEVNPADFELNDQDNDSKIFKSRSAFQKQNLSLNELTWPPITHSSTQGIFYITPLVHLNGDPRFLSNTDDKKSKRKETRHFKTANSVLSDYSSKNQQFEPIYHNEPEEYISKRMDSFNAAWNVCNLKCEKILKNCYKENIRRICQFIKGNHIERDWNVSIIPTAVIFMGLNTSDHSIIIDLISTQLCSASSFVSILSPKNCTSLTSLMKSMLQQFISDLSAASECSFRTIVEFRTKILNKTGNFQLTIVFEDLEQFNPEVLSDFIIMASHYSKKLNLAFIMPISSSEEALQFILPQATLNHLSCLNFNMIPSTNVIDIMLKECFLSHLSPFRLSINVLKWLLENVNYLNFSVSSFVHKLKFIHFRFYYKNSLSWILNDLILKQTLLSIFKSNEERKNYPFEQALSKFWSKNPEKHEKIVLDLLKSKFKHQKQDIDSTNSKKAAKTEILDAETDDEIEHHNNIENVKYENKHSRYVSNRQSEPSIVIKDDFSEHESKETEERSWISYDLDSNDDILIIDTEHHQKSRNDDLNDSETENKNQKFSIENENLETEDLNHLFDEQSMAYQFDRWVTDLKRRQVLQSVCLDLLLIAKYLIPLSSIISVNNNMTNFKHSQMMMQLHENDQDLPSHANSCRISQTFFALLKSPYSTIQSIFDKISNQLESLQFVLEQWQALLDTECQVDEKRPLCSQLLKLVRPHLNNIKEALTQKTEQTNQMEGTINHHTSEMEGTSNHLTSQIEGTSNHHNSSKAAEETIEMMKEMMEVAFVESSEEPNPLLDTFTFDDVHALQRHFNPNLHLFYVKKTLSLIEDIELNPTAPIVDRKPKMSSATTTKTQKK